MPPKIAKIEVCYMAGTCTGTLKTGTRYHAVPGPVCNGALPKALCGRKPSITWSDPSETRAVNCPACLRALKNLAPIPLAALLTLLNEIQALCEDREPGRQDFLAVARTLNQAGVTGPRGHWTATDVQRALDGRLLVVDSSQST